MALSLGVDTGGTYTDAVLVRDEEEVIASAKSLTTKQDLSIGIGTAIAAVLEAAQTPARDITMASLSTTLATNALVEGQGGRIAFVAIGMKEADLEKHGIIDALRGDPYLVITGGHTHAGSEAAPLDVDAIETWLSGLDGISGFAIAAQFATRNPAHEVQVAEMLRPIAPVSCSHELSAKLGGPKRAMTAVLNARLIGLTHALIGKAEEELTARGIDAPLLVVRGDGALMSSQEAKLRPIETILSGPAASIVGANWLTKAETALVSDIGGTTTDVALLRDGRPAIDADGARVGPYRTMVEAVAMRTHGLGGDSEVAMREGLEGGVVLGPKRVVPVSLMAHEHPELVDLLEAQLRETTTGEHAGRFVRRIKDHAAGIDPRDVAVFERITQPMPVQSVLRNRRESAALGRLWSRGIIQIAGLTPSDASHMLGYTDAWNKDAAEMALELMARRRAGHGNRLAETPRVLARMIEKELHQRTVLALLDAAFAEDRFEANAEDFASHPLMQAGLDHHQGLVRLSAGLNVPVVGLGASASTYYPAVGQRLGTAMHLPEHGSVANAIGAVVGKITARQEGTITAPSEGLFRVHLAEAPQDFTRFEEALEALETTLIQSAQAKAKEEGAIDTQTHVSRDIRKAKIEERDIIVEAQIKVEVTGRARVAVNAEPV